MSTKITLIKDRLTMLQLIALRARVQSGNLGWIIYEAATTFTPVHKVLGDPDNGPVVLIADDLFEVDIDETTFYPSEDAARDAYWKMDKRARPGADRKHRGLVR